MSNIPFKVNNGPDLKEAANIFKELCTTIAALRDKKNGCPWDLEQDHKSLRKYMIEEAYEASAVMENKEDSDELCQELGDVLLQVILNAQVSLDNKGFSIVEVLNAINSKMLRRHPHVFGNEEERKQKDISAIHKSWQQIKNKEKNIVDVKRNFFDDKSISKVHPATNQAFEIGKKAAQIDFDWANAEEAMNILFSEFNELKEEWQKGKKRDFSNLCAEIGDVYFSLAQVCRHLDLSPEVTAQDGNYKFLKRFKILERLAGEKGIDIEKATQQQLSTLWREAKKIKA